MLKIIIPCYNCLETLPKTLASLLSQTDSDFLVHLIDDASTQDLSPIIEHFSQYLNIVVTRNETNVGCGMSRQVGIDNIDADYITFLDSDDVLMPYAVAGWKNSIKNNPEADIIFSFFYEEDRNKKFKLITNGYTWMHGKVYKLDFIKKWGIRNDPRVKWADDSFFNSMCMELGNMVIFPSPTYCWLYNEGSITRKKDFPQSKSLEDFGNAMKISAEFLHSKGVKKIGHIPKTIELIESKKEFYIKNNSEQQYNELLEFLKQYL